MSLRQGLALLGLLILPACLDPIVGSQCATGYSPCRGVCVATGACTTLDAAGGTADEAGSAVDGDSGAIDAGVALDSTNLGTSVDADGIGEVPAIDAEPADTKIAQDVPAHDDVPGQDDVPALADFGAPPIVAVDASLDTGERIDEGALESGPPCVDCVDAEGAGEGGNVDDAGVDDAGVDDADNSGAVDGALVCTNPQVICNEQCVDQSADPENCGECNTICSSGVCNDGVCLDCAPESVCGRQCMDLFHDPDNCGVCGNSCGSGLCNNGQCEAAGTGRAIVIGHDYLKNRPAMNRILGNAVFLWPVNPVRLLVYEGDANATAIAGADAAIAQVASATGRQAVRTNTVGADASALLASTDVFLIYGQEHAVDPTLNQLGLDWSAALLAFVNSGGTVVLLDGVYADNSGTIQILVQAGLFQIARGVSATGHVCTVVSHGDALATGLPKTYLCEMNSTSFVVSGSPTVTSVVEDSGRTVVVHKLF